MPDPKQPPYSIESEQNVLGGLMLSNNAIDVVREIVCERDFYRSDHQLIYRNIVEMLDRNVPVDFSTLTEHLRLRKLLDEAGGLAYLGMLAADTPSVANIAQYARAVLDRAVMRRLIAAGQDISNLGFRPDGEDIATLLAKAQAFLQTAEVEAVDDVKPIGDYISPWYDELERRRSSSEVGMSTGLRDLDSATGGMEDGDMWVIAARSAMGKTHLGLGIALHVAATHGAVAGFSMEMPRNQWISRIVSSRGEIHLGTLRRPGQLSDGQVDQVVWTLNHLRKLPFYVDERAALTVDQIRARCRIIKRKHGLRLVLIDYLQLMKGRPKKGENRTNELGEISRGIKALAKELGCPVIALAQINREVDKRDDKRPRVADIRECGDIENDADVIVGLYRDEKYHKDSPHKGVAEAILMKQRQGEECTVELEFEGEYSRFRDWNGPSFKERLPPPPEKPAKTTKSKAFGAKSEADETPAKSARKYGDVDA